MDREPSNRGLLWLIVAALAAWCVLLALGAYLGLDPGTPDHDLRRMGVALLAIGGFIGVWMAALWVRGRRW
jgi:membrane protein DedA with SNARE-associated domain